MAHAFAWVPFSVAQSGKNAGDLQFMGIGTDADGPKSMWMTIANVDGDFQLEAAQQQVLVADLPGMLGGTFVISDSPFVSSGNGGVHRLFVLSGGKFILVDTQNQKGGVNVPSGRPDTGLVTAPRPRPVES